MWLGSLTFFVELEVSNTYNASELIQRILGFNGSETTCEKGSGPLTQLEPTLWEKQYLPLLEFTATKC